MDNDNEIKDLVDIGKEEFLSGLTVSKKSIKEEYDLASEFRKTKSNNNWFIRLGLLGFVILFIGAAYIVNSYIEKETKNVDVSISDFNDINLKDILDLAKKYEKDMEKTIREKKDLEETRDALLREVDEDLALSLKNVNEEMISDEEKAQKIEKLKEEARLKKEQILEEYNSKIAEKEKMITEIQGKIAAYDSRLLDQAREQEQKLNNQQRLFEIEKESLVEYYENSIKTLTEDYEKRMENIVKKNDELVNLLNKKYIEDMNSLFTKFNPEFENTQLSSLINEQALSGIEPPPAGDFQSLWEKEGLMTREKYNNILLMKERAYLLLNRLQEIPYERSVPKALEQIEIVAMYLVSDYEVLWSMMTDKIVDKNNLINFQDNMLAEITYGISAYTANSHENGYIIDPRNPDDIVFYINDIYGASVGDKAYVFRSEEEYIGIITIKELGERKSAVLVSLEDKKKPILPFDKLLIRLTGGNHEN